MRVVVGFLILYIVLVLRLIPCLLSFLICNGNEGVVKADKQKKEVLYIKAALAALLNFVVYFISHRAMLHRWNILETIKCIVLLDFSYQDIDYLPISLVITTIASVVIGLTLRGRKHIALKSNHVGLISLLSLQALACVTFICIGFSGSKHILINEIQPKKSIMAQNMEFGEYIELYNEGYLNCYIYKLYISDDRNNLKEYEIPSTMLGAHERMIIDAETAGITLSSSGYQEFILSDEIGNIIDSVITEPVKRGEVYCRASDGEDNWIIANATPGLSNESAEPIFETIPSPAFSCAAGFYENPFELELSVEDDSKIYYTLDGAIPTVDSLYYDAPIYIYDRSDEENQILSVKETVTDWDNKYSDKYQNPVDKAFIVRAIAIDDEGNKSDVVTSTYFIDKDSYEAGSVLSIVADPESLIGDNGIYVAGKEYKDWYMGDQDGDKPEANYLKHGRQYEVPASMEYFSKDLTFKQNVGLRINGGSSRDSVRKSLGLYAREEYGGKDVFDEDVFLDIESSKLGTRGGFANSVIQMMARNGNRDVATQQVKRVALFLNGEFIFNTNVIEKYDGKYFEEHYGIPETNVIVYNDGITEGTEEDRAYRDEIFEFIENNDLSNDEAYKEFGDIIDIQSYIDYMAIRVYICDMDYTEQKNNVMWRSREKFSSNFEDGKWRWALYDLDGMEWNDADYWGRETKAELDAFSLKPKFTSKINEQSIFVALKKNESFKKDFVNTFMDLANSIFSYENALDCINEYGPDTTDYQGGNGGTRDFLFYDEFFKNRGRYAVKYLADEFDLKGSLETVSVGMNDSEGGSVKLNTINIDMSQGVWNGDYYTDYPVMVSAISNEGYHFVKWVVDGKNYSEDTLEVEVKEGGTDIYAVFEK